MFQVSGIQFLWTQAFVVVWGLDQNWVTLMFLVVTGCGSGVGIALGPRHIDKRGGFREAPGICRSLRSLYMFALIAAAGGFFAVVCIVAKAVETEQWWADWGDPYLYLTWFSSER